MCDVAAFESDDDELVRGVGDAPGEDRAHEIAPDAFVQVRPASFAALEDHAERLVQRQVLAADARLHVRFDHVQRVEQSRDECAQETACEEIIPSKKRFL